MAMPAGAPTKLDDKKLKAITDAVATGSTLERASAWAGITSETLRRWRRRGEQAEAIPAGRRSPSQRKSVELCAALDKALAECAVRMQAIVFDLATQTDDKAVALRAATWYLSHRERDDYAPRGEITGKDGGPVELSGLDALALLRGLAEAHPDNEE